ncbi:MAG TPA: ATP-binding cassette domain-containing protein [Virgibacillus sp.]|nr:ATP-binding cassette domain-containing protein [Virgibacillus sp.]
MREILSFDNVTKVFKQGDNEITALNQANFSINEGEFVAVVDPSSFGKSTFLVIIGGLLKLSSGDVHLNEESIVNIPDKNMTFKRLHHIGFIF